MSNIMLLGYSSVIFAYRHFLHIAIEKCLLACNGLYLVVKN